jgi:hypothetical protein
MGKRKYNEAVKTERKTDVRRPDRAKRLALRKTIEDFAITGSFGGRLAHQCLPAIKRYFQETIDEYVLSISQMAVRASLVCNEVLFKYFDDGLGAPPIGETTFFRQCFTGVGKHQVVKDVLLTVFHDRLEIPRHEGDWASITYAVNQYQTSFRNSIIGNFDKRLGKLVSEWVHKFSPTARDGVVGSMIRSILGQPGDEIDSDLLLTEEMCVFVSTMREKFDHPLNFDSSEAKIDLLLKYSYIILTCHREYGLRGGFSLAPLCGMRRHHISIDSTVLYSILRKTAKYFNETAPDWIRTITSLTSTEFMQKDESGPYTYRQYAWMHFFNVFGLSSKDFAERILTDGVKCSVMFTRPKRTPSADPDETHLQNWIMISSAERVVAIDPGRTNLVTALEIDGNGKEIFRALTRRSYYDTFSHAVQGLKRSNERLRDVDEEFSLYSPRSSLSILREGYIGVYFQQYDRIWHERGSKRHARARFYIMSKKRSALDKFFQQFKSPDQPDPIVLYGAARMRSHGTRGELAVPVKGVLKACKRYFCTVMVDEYRTSKRHSKCHLDMHPVRTRSRYEEETRRERSKRTVRGLYYCGNCKKFVDRDRDACRSIMEAGMSAIRPDYLCRGTKAVWTSPVDKLPYRLD